MYNKNDRKTSTPTQEKFEKSNGSLEERLFMRWHAPWIQRATRCACGGCGNNRNKKKVAHLPFLTHVARLTARLNGRVTRAPFRLAGAAFLGSRPSRSLVPTTPQQQESEKHPPHAPPGPTQAPDSPAPPRPLPIRARRSVRRGRADGKLGSARRGSPTRPNRAGNFQPKPLTPRGGAPKQNWLRPPPSSPISGLRRCLPAFFTPCAYSLAVGGADTTSPAPETRTK